MAKPKKDVPRETFSVRLNPELLIQLKHLAIDSRRPVSDLLEEGISLVLKQYKQTKT